MACTVEPHRAPGKKAALVSVVPCKFRAIGCCVTVHILSGSELGTVTAKRSATGIRRVSYDSTDIGQVRQHVETIAVENLDSGMFVIRFHNNTLVGMAAPFSGGGEWGDLLRRIPLALVGLTRSACALEGPRDTFLYSEVGARQWVPVYTMRLARISSSRGDL